MTKDKRVFVRMRKSTGKSLCLMEFAVFLFILHHLCDIVLCKYNTQLKIYGIWQSSDTYIWLNKQHRNKKLPQKIPRQNITVRHNELSCDVTRAKTALYKVPQHSMQFCISFFLVVFFRYCRRRFFWEQDRWNLWKERRGRLRTS